MSRITAYAMDFGTSNSLLKPIFAQKNDLPSQTIEMKSISFCDDNFSWSFGDQAIDEYTIDPMSGRLFKSLKRFMPESSFEGTYIFHKFYSMADLISIQIKHMKDLADQQHQQVVDKVVMGHPALFSENIDSHKLALQRLENAAKIAGFKEVIFCAEPVAAAYNYHQTLTEEKLILVVDLGGGTSDFTVCKLQPNNFSANDVLALHGIPLAGDQFDSVIMQNKIAPYYGSKVKYKLPMSQNWLEFPKSFLNKLCRPADLLMLSSASNERFIKDAQRYAESQQDKKNLDLLLSLVDERLGFALFRMIENTKIALSQKDHCNMKFDPHGILHFEENITMKEFVEFSQYSVSRILQTLDETLQKAQVSAQDIDHVFVTGGTAQIPMIQEKLRSQFANKIKQGTIFHSVVEGLVEFGKKNA